MKSFEDVVDFHGHACPGLALGYRVAVYVMEVLGERAADEEFIAIIENNSCAVDAVQVITGCTFGKGNLIFKDYGKQVYTFIKRNSEGWAATTGDGIRISVDWNSPVETQEEKNAWDRYIKGDHSEEVLKIVHDRKAKKLDTIMNAGDEELLKVKKVKMDLPAVAKIYPSLRCTLCAEKMMEPRARVKDGEIVCIPCFESGIEK
jgi:formylmethanofuran dehydrogenase subunit E